jgi:Type II secretion system (T2SS), protein M subtype b
MGNFALQKRLIIAGLAVLLLIDGAFAYYSMKLSSATRNPQQVLAAEKLQLGLLKSDVERASIIKKKIPGYVKDFDTYESNLPLTSNGYSVITGELSEVAKANHVQMENQRFHPKDVSGRDLQEVDIETTISGDYAAIVRFLNALQRSKNTYIVDSLGLESEPSNPGTPQVGPAGLKVELHLRTFFRKV